MAVELKLILRTIPWSLVLKTCLVGLLWHYLSLVWFFLAMMGWWFFEKKVLNFKAFFFIWLWLASLWKLFLETEFLGLVLVMGLFLVGFIINRMRKEERSEGIKGRIIDSLFYAVTFMSGLIYFESWQGEGAEVILGWLLMTMTWLAVILFYVKERFGLIEAEVKLWRAYGALMTVLMAQAAWVIGYWPVAAHYQAGVFLISAIVVSEYMKMVAMRVITKKKILIILSIGIVLFLILVKGAETGTWF